MLWLARLLRVWYPTKTRAVARKDFVSNHFIYSRMKLFTKIILLRYFLRNELPHNDKLSFLPCYRQKSTSPSSTSFNHICLHNNDLLRTNTSQNIWISNNGLKNKLTLLKERFFNIIMQINSKQNKHGCIIIVCYNYW